MFQPILRAIAVLFPEKHFRTFLCLGVAFAAVGMASCGDWCFAGYSVNGNGGATVGGGSTATTCSVSSTTAKVRVAAVKSAVCEGCTASARVEHVYVTVNGVQLGEDSADAPHSLQWRELASELAASPRQLDLMGSSDAEILVPGTSVAAGNYREARLQFYTRAPVETSKLRENNPCGTAGWNCVMLADGRVEPIRFPDDVAEIRIRLMENAPLALLPESSTELRLNVLAQREFSVSGGNGLAIQYRLIGSITSIGGTQD